MVRLIEHEPYGPKGEVGKWAANINALRRLPKQLSRGTHFVFVITAASIQSADE